jgi:hypothetical protein
MFGARPILHISRIKVNMLLVTAASISDVDFLFLVGDISTLQYHVLYLNMLVDHVLGLNI